MGAALASALLTACSPEAEAPVRFLIGVSQANLSEPWRISMTDEIRRQAELHPELRIIVADASDSLGKQIGDLEKFEGLGVDLLIVSPLESEAITPTVTRIYQSIPVIVLNRSVANYDYTVFIGPDNARIGQEAGRFVARTLADTGGEVLEVLGRSGSPPTLERAQGFRHEVARNRLVRLQSPILANWLRDGAEDLVLERLKVDDPPRVIFAHNDAMAYGAWLAAESLGLDRRITFVGVDGLPGPRGGQELLRTGILDATLLSPTGGKEAVEYALALLNHRGEQPKKVILGTRFLTRDTLDASPVGVSRPLRVAYHASSSPDAWSQRLRASTQGALRRGGWTLVPAGSDLPENVDALVVDATDRDADEGARRLGLEARARERGVPVFRLGPQPPADDEGWVLALGPEPLEEGRRGARWLVSEGRRRVVELAGPLEPGAKERHLGATQVLAEAGARVVEARFVGGRDDARKAVEALLGTTEFDAIFAHSDEAALGAADALRDASQGRRPPIVIASVGGGSEALAALREGRIGSLVRSPADLGDLLRTDLERAFQEPGVPRRLVTSHDVLTP